MCATFNAWNKQLIIGGQKQLFIYSVLAKGDAVIQLTPLVYFEVPPATPPA